MFNGSFADLGWNKAGTILGLSGFGFKLSEYIVLMYTLYRYMRAGYVNLLQLVKKRV